MLKRVQHDEMIEEEGKKRVIRVFRVVRDQRIRESENSRFKVQDSRFKVQDSKFKIQNYYCPLKNQARLGMFVLSDSRHVGHIDRLFRVKNSRKGQESTNNAKFHCFNVKHISHFLADSR